MNFGEAFKQMKENGAKVKLPSWGGYWRWDDEKQTIMMHCRPQDSDTQGEVLDIRQTERVEYTTQNILSDEWVFADSENTPALGGVAQFSFSEALKYLKRGMKVARSGWNGKDMYITLIPAGNAVFQGCAMQNCFGLKTGNGEMQPGWVPSIRDCLAEDWNIVE